MKVWGVFFFAAQELEDGSGHFILASDGVWEFLTNEDVAKLAHSCWDCPIAGLVS